MSKADYKISLVSKAACVPLLQRYHYLSKISKGFKSGCNVGLYKGETLVGVCIFTGWPVPELLQDCFGLPRTEQEGFWELSRLVLSPTVQSEEHNLASWFVSRAVRLLRANYTVRSVLSYADEGFHEGTVYAASNFSYYGLSAVKKDFWIEQPDHTFVKHSRGPVKGLSGEWRPRNRKHRFLLTYDTSLSCKWQEETWKPLIREDVMDFKKYQEQSREFAIYDKKYSKTYPLIALMGELGEVASKFSKVQRDNDGNLPSNWIDDMTLEGGDILWNISQWFTDNGVCMDEAARRNLAKLKDRKARGVIGGSGDYR